MSDDRMEEVPVEEQEKHQSTPKIKQITDDGGVIKQIIKKGTGYEKPKSGSEVTVHYVGTLLDGTEFDSSRGRNQPFQFKLDSGSVIKGWDKAVATMKKGEIAKVTLAPEYAYGKSGSGKIPGNATLVFEIELLSWLDEKDLTNDGGVMKKILKEGEGWDTPNYEAKVNFNIKILGANGVVYLDNTSKQFEIGNEDIPKGLEKALESMKKGEKSRFKVQANYGYGKNGNEELKIPPDTDIVYEIEMFDFEMGKQSYQLEKFEEKYELAIRRKNDGNKFFENNKLEYAMQKYEKSLDLFKHDTSLSEEQKKTVNESIKLTCHLNIAAVALKQNNLKQAIENCNKALEIDERNVKGLWRRGMAYTADSDWEEAGRDFEKALQIDPQNKVVKSAYSQLKKKKEQADKKDRKRYNNLFQRLHEVEEKELQEQKKEDEAPAEKKEDKDVKIAEKKEEKTEVEMKDVDTEKK